MRTFNLRLPDELYDRLKGEAETDHRSMNAEIVWLLQQVVSRERARP